MSFECKSTKLNILKICENLFTVYMEIKKVFFFQIPLNDSFSLKKYIFWGKIIITITLIILNLF